MEATAQEVAWAVAIERAAQQDERMHTDGIADLEHLQHAIVAKSKVKPALQGLCNLQCLKESHSIKGDGSADEAARDFAACRSGFWMCLAQFPEKTNKQVDRSSACPTFCKETDSKQQEEPHIALPDEQDLSEGPRHCPHVLCLDAAKAIGAKTKNEKAFAVLMRVLFYILQAMNYNALAMRSGYCHLEDSAGFGWRNFSLEIDKCVSQLYFDNAYPVRIRQLGLLSASLLAQGFYKMLSFFLTPSVRKLFIFAGNRDEFFFGKHNNQNEKESSIQYIPEVLPKEWGGTVDSQDFVEQVLTRLHKRYENAATFRLPK